MRSLFQVSASKMDFYELFTVWCGKRCNDKL